MTRDEIIRVAREAGATTVDADDPQCWIGSLAFTRQELERFYRAAFAAGAAAEREACAKVVIDMVDNGHGVVDRITAAIRARGND